MTGTLVQHSGLEARLRVSLARFQRGAGEWGLALPQPVKLAQRAAWISAKFDDGTPGEPGADARQRALAKLRMAPASVTRKDWCLIAWGLCDSDDTNTMLLEDAALFPRVVRFIEVECGRGIARRIWFGLLHSYFAYDSDHPERSEGWCTLRSILARTLEPLVSSQSRPKRWALALRRHADLLTDDAGRTLAASIFDNDSTIADEIATYFPVPQTSWLWRSVVRWQLLMLDEADDDRMKAVIPALLFLAAQRPVWTDRILAATLTRYESSRYRNDAHAELKQFALERWQNPQIRSANRWSSVSAEVRKMVVQWFAKADLEHFFSLLQGEGGVDRARLDYWLRFVDQISWTRIVMGADAAYNRSADFIDFRAKNKGRYSNLAGGDTSNNAFVMQIGEYYLVEFSGTGNACYVYSEKRLPFDPFRANFQLAELKQKSSAIDRLIHNGAWQYKADFALARLGIRAGQSSAKPQTRSALPPRAIVAPVAFSAGPPAAPATPARGFADSSQKAAASRSSRLEHAVQIGTDLAIRKHLQRRDQRAVNGTFWIVDDGNDDELRTRLTDLGYQFAPGIGYWII